MTTGGFKGALLSALVMVSLIASVLMIASAPGTTIIVYASPDCVEPPSGLVSWWPGDGNAFDIIDGNHGTLVNGATFAPGKVSQAFSFDGIDDVVLTPGTNIDDLQQLTIDTWVKLDSLPPGQIERFVTLTGEKAVLRYDGGNGPRQLHFYMKIDGELRHIRVNNVLETGVFHHVAGTYDGSVMRLYLDGVEVGSLTISGIVGAGSGIELSAVVEPLDGLLDEIEIYNRALSPSEIQAIFSADIAGKRKPLPMITDVTYTTSPPFRITARITDDVGLMYTGLDVLRDNLCFMCIGPRLIGETYSATWYADKYALTDGAVDVDPVYVAMDDARSIILVNCLFDEDGGGPNGAVQASASFDPTTLKLIGIYSGWWSTVNPLAFIPGTSTIMPYNCYFKEIGRTLFFPGDPPDWEFSPAGVTYVITGGPGNYNPYLKKGDAEPGRYHLNLWATDTSWNTARYWFELIMPTPVGKKVEYLHFLAWIDGSDYLHIQGNNVWYVHRNFQYPGIWAANNPTYVNGDPWYPIWPDNWGYDDYGQRSLDTYTNLVPPQPSYEIEITLEVIQARWEISIVQYPSSSNDYTTIVLLNDDPPGGAAWYEFKLSIYTPIPVGGIAFPPNKLALLAPWIAFAVIITIVAVTVAVYWRRYRT